MSDSKRAKGNMDESLDLLLSASIDDELEAGEREELGRALANDPAAADRRARFEAVDDALRTVAASPASESELAAGLAAIRARLADENPTSPYKSSGRQAGGQQSGGRGRRMRSWVPALVLAAAAAWLIYLVLPGRLLPGAPAYETAVRRDAGVDSLAAETSDAIATASEEQLLALADARTLLTLIFGLDEDSEGTGTRDALSAEDFEVVEQLELMEYLAAREMEGRG